MENKLQYGLKQLDLYDNEKAEKLFSYAKELQEKNEEFGLSTITDFDEIIIRHILDSVVAVKIIESIKDEILSKRNIETQTFTIADIGSGGGIPGIPLSIMMPDINFMLVERMTKRCAFLAHCKEKLQLSNITIETLEAERVEQKKYDICVFRAFRPLDKKITRVLLRIIKEDGSLIAYKAKKDKILEEMTLIQQWVPSYKLIPLEVPFLEDYERHLVVVNKNN